MLSKFKKYFFIFLSGLIVGGAGMYFIKSDKPVKSSDIKVTQLSGEKINHSKYQFSGNSISFETEAEGQGKIKTEIPKKLIPEANAWLTKTHSIQFNYIYQYHNSSFFSSYSLSYYHRFGSLAIGGGIIVSKESAGLIGGAQIWF